MIYDTNYKLLRKTNWPRFKDKRRNIVFFCGVLQIYKLEFKEMVLPTNNCSFNERTLAQSNKTSNIWRYII